MAAATADMLYVCRAEAGDHKCCLVVAEPALLIKAGLLNEEDTENVATKIDLCVDSTGDDDKPFRKHYSSSACKSTTNNIRKQ